MEANASHVAFMTEQAGSMSFEDSDNYYHPGHPYSGKVKSIWGGTLEWSSKAAIVLYVLPLGGNRDTGASEKFPFFISPRDSLSIPQLCLLCLSQPHCVYLIEIPHPSRVGFAG